MSSAFLYRISGRFYEMDCTCDKIEEIFAGLRSLHDDDEAVWALEVVQQGDHAPHPAHAVQQAHLQGHTLSANLGR